MKKSSHYLRLLAIGALAVGCMSNPGNALSSGASNIQVVQAAEMNTSSEALARVAIKDPELLKALAALYNEENSASKTDETLLLSDLQEIKSLDLFSLRSSSTVDISQITSLEFLRTTDTTGISRIGQLLPNLTSIDLAGTGIKSIPSEAFRQHPNLESVTLPNELTNIGKSSFEGCEKLTQFSSKTAAGIEYKDTLPISLTDKASSADGTDMGSNAFKGCKSLTKVVVPALTNSSGIQNAAYMFADCNSLTEVEISNRISVIPDGFLSGAGVPEKDENGEIPPVEYGFTFTIVKTDAVYGLETINDSAFENSAVTAVDLSECKSLSAVKKNAFKNCKKLETFIFPHECGTLTVGEYCLYGTEKLLVEGQPLDKEKEVLDEEMINPSLLKKVILPKSCESLSLGFAAFACNYYLEDVYAYTEGEASGVITPDYLQEQDFAKYMFAGDMSIKSVVFTLPVAPEHTFYNCFRIEDISFGSTDKLVSVEQLAFFNTRVKNLNFPSTLNYIGSKAFAVSEHLESITWNTPSDAAAANLVLEEGAFRSALKLTTIRDTGSNNTENVLPVTLKSLGGYAFDGCIALKSIYLTDNIEGESPAIGMAAFGDCYALEKAGLPSTLTEIPDYCFGNAIKLQELPGAYAYNKETKLMEETDSAITTIRDYAFQYCFELSLANKPIYDSVTAIGAYAFYANANLQKLQFGPNLKSIAPYVFSDTGIIYDSSYDMLDDGTLQFLPEATNQNSAKIPATNVIFSQATGLAEIGEGAFMHSPIEAVDLTGTQVTQIQPATFAGCAYLKEFTCNPEMRYVAANSLSGDPSLSKFEVISTTTVDTSAFYRTELINSELYDVTPLSKLTFNVNPAMVEVSAGNTINFPFYVIPGSSNSIGDLIIGTENSGNNELYKHVKVTAFIGKQNNYYCNRSSASYAVPEGDFFSRLAEPALAPINGTNVNVLQIEGLRTTQGALDGQDSIPFTVRVNYSVYQNENGASINKTIPTQYYVEVTDATPTCVNLLSHDLGDGIKNNLTVTKDHGSFTVAGTYTADKTYRMTFAPGSPFTYTYDIKDLYNPEIIHSSKEIVVETSNPDVVCLDPNNPTVTSIETAEGAFSGFVQKTGNATIKVYPKDMAQVKDAVALVINYSIIANVSDMELTVPAEYQLAVEEGATFPILSKIGFSNGIVIAANEETGLFDPEELAAQTDATFTFESSNPEVATIDENGIVTIKKVADTSETVTFTVKATNAPADSASEPVVAEKTLDFKVTKFTSLSPVLYSDQARTKVVTGNQTMHLSDANKNGSILYFFNYKKAIENSDYVPETCNLIVESSNPEVIYPYTPDMTQLSENGVAVNKWLIPCTPKNGEINTLDLMTADRFVYLVAAKCGSTTIKIYSENDPKNFISFSVTAVSDIADFSVSIPESHKYSQKPGESFSILDTIVNFEDAVVSRETNTISKWKTITDNTITFKSNNPKIATIDANGIVTIKQVTYDPVTVTFTATAKLSSGAVIERATECTICYPPLSSGSDLTVPGGAKVSVVSLGADANEPNVAVYKSAPAGASTVNVPAAITISGKTFKITSIAENAFANNTKLQSVTIANGITTISKGAFMNCTSLKSVVLPNTLTTIEDNAFAKCTALTKISIPANTTTIGNKAFYGCKKLKTVSISTKSKLTVIGNSAFEKCTSLTKILLPKKLTTIGKKAFYGCKKLKTVTTKTSVLESIGSKAFKNISKTAVVKVPKKKLATYKPAFKKAGVSGKKQKIKK